jgi:hypothetical protein
MLAVAPTAAEAAGGVSSSSISSWVSSEPQTPANDPYLIYSDNPPSPTLTVSGRATATSPSDAVDIDCFYGPETGPTIATLATNVPVNGGAFTASVSAVSFKKLVGHACRLRAMPHNGNDPESTAFTGPEIAVSEAESVVIASGPNTGKSYDFFLNSVTLTGTTAWSAPGTPSPTPLNLTACGGPNLAPIDESFNIGTPAIDCAGALMGDDSGAWGGRSEVQVDGRNAYDAASAQALFAATTPPRAAHPTPASQDLAGFPSLSTTAQWDPTSGLIASSDKESWVACNGPNAEVPTFAICPNFTPTGVQLQRDISATDGGRVVTLTDTWFSTDNGPHTLDLLYDDSIGFRNSHQRGYVFPNENGFSTPAAGDLVPGPSGAPGSIVAHTNVAAMDGDPGEGFGAITFSRAPSSFRFEPFPPPAPPTTPPSFEFEEHHVLQIPAGGSTSLNYVYSVGYTQAAVTAMALAAQDRLQPLAVAVTAPANGAMTSTSPVTVIGTARAGSGISSLVIAGLTVPVAPDGTWSVNVPLNPGPNTLGLLATDAAGNSAQGQLTVVYQPPPAPPSPPPPSAVKCKVPRTKGMKLLAAERALRRAHCNVGRIKHLTSKKLAQGRVMSTTPRAGRRLAAGTKVELFISKGS